MHPTTIFLVPPSSWEQRKEQTRDKGKTELEPHLGPAGNPPPTPNTISSGPPIA
jgi:hypothetical protein